MSLGPGFLKKNNKKSLKRSIRYQQIKLFAKPLIFAGISVFVVALVYISSTPFIVYAERPDPNWWKSNDCGTHGGGTVRMTWCCWTENGVKYCQTCVPITEGPDKGEQECTTKEKQSLEQPPTPPVFDPTAPLQEGVLEQPEQPLFGGQNDAGVPPTGGIEQPPTATTQPTPGGGGNVPTEGGSAEQPPQTVAPQDQGNQGGGLPTIKNQENVPPGGGVAEQPEDDGQQEDSSEGAETSGPLT